MASKHILVVDDEIGIRELLRDILQDEGYYVDLAENASIARSMRLHTRPDMVLLDIWMPDCDGITLLKEWADGGLLTMPVVMMSGHGTIDTAVEATRIGAIDFLEKPIALQKLLKTVASALKHSEQLPKSEMNLARLGKSPTIVTLKERLEKIAASTQLAPSPVLLIANKGGGAELCARFLHHQHKPDNTPWLQLTAFDQLINAPLAILEQARDGLIYIDEVASLNRFEQKGLLLLITKAEKYNVRVVCTTHQDLPKLQTEALFDYDLLQILLPVSLRIPALEEHKEDIPELVVSMANLQFEQAGMAYREFDTSALNALRNASWPGDLAQLNAVIHNLILTSLDLKITLDDTHRVLHQFDVITVTTESGNDGLTPVAHPNNIGLSGAVLNLTQPLREARDDFERLYFEHHIKLIANNVSKLAEVSGLERTHLYRKLKQLGIKVKS